MGSSDAYDDSTLHGKAGEPVSQIPGIIQDEDRQTARLTKAQSVILVQFLVCTASFIESADMAMLTGIFKVLEETVAGATPQTLGLMMTVQAFLNCAVLPIWGYYADRYNRLWLFTLSICGIAIFTLATAFCWSMSALFVVRGACGLSKAGLSPVIQGLVATHLPPESRAKVFGWIFLFGNLGAFVGSFTATAASHEELYHRAAWRFVFVFMFLVTLAFALVVNATRGQISEARPALRSRELDTTAWQDLKDITSIQSFRLILLQGIFASSSVAAAHFSTMWFQYMGYDDVESALLVGFAAAGGALGSVTSGYVSDWLVQSHPVHGRVFWGQCGDLLRGLLLLAGLIHFREYTDGNHFHGMGAVVFGYNFLSVMSYVGAIKPLLTEIVPPRLSSSCLAYAAGIDGAFAAFLGNSFVGVMAQQVFGYKTTKMSIEEMPSWLRLHNKRALGMTLFSLIFGASWMMLLIFSMLHITLPSDKEAAQREEEKEIQAAKLLVKDVEAWEAEAQANLFEAGISASSARSRQA